MPWNSGPTSMLQIMIRFQLQSGPDCFLRHAEATHDLCMHPNGHLGKKKKKKVTSSFSKNLEQKQEVTFFLPEWPFWGPQRHWVVRCKKSYRLSQPLTLRPLQASENSPEATGAELQSSLEDQGFQNRRCWTRRLCRPTNILHHKI